MLITQSRNREQLPHETFEPQGLQYFHGVTHLEAEMTVYHQA